ncbi:S-adenosyl-L-methionine-dependent methyltransferase [Kockovaella imperatae]|uniref:S-adenosyl-L-methionine-dependent methyltransferase n=1 Tax=Kockovaella imperatae TaxID=4999 RepID=A0A1Y1UEQ5_9TREE|nr:S-adenosyl-L-methionine-dependent methyltransferase [Kockovaella imperatae]ORX36508.1 S-adenosyl-L-methionine-dependent methyltransferase [Kockovaella imperatae]
MSKISPTVLQNYVAEGDQANLFSTVDFGELTMLTRPPIFIPRAETAYIMDHLADILLEHPVMSTLERPLRILDLCTGSGSLALMLAHRLRSKAHLTAVDINPEAVTLARENAALNGLTSHVDFVVQDFTTSDLGEASFDLVVSNPPYIPHGEWETLSPSVKDHEDPRALIGDPQDFPAQSREHPISESSDGQGLYFYRKIAQKLPLFCKSSILRQSRGLPLLAVECGATQADDVQHIFKTQTSGLISSTTVVKDQFGQDRMVIGLT